MAAVRGSAGMCLAGSFLTIALGLSPMARATPPEASGGVTEADRSLATRAVAELGRDGARDALVALGFDYLRNRHDPLTAERRFREAALIDPADCAAAVGAAEARAARGDAEAGPIAAARRADAGCLVERASFLLRIGRPDEARDILLIAPMPADARRTALGAVAAFRAGYYAEACRLAKAGDGRGREIVGDSLERIAEATVCRDYPVQVIGGAAP